MNHSSTNIPKCNRKWAETIQLVCRHSIAYHFKKVSFISLQKVGKTTLHTLAIAYFHIVVKEMLVKQFLDPLRFNSFCQGTCSKGEADPPEEAKGRPWVVHVRVS